jgi:hypothetical protein
MGGLEVTLLKSDGNDVGDAGQTYPVRYAPPFYGSTAFEYMGYNVTDYNDTQKSYGMWFVPPDIGITVIVHFMDGDPAQGYWTNCVPSRFVNNMVPGIAASDRVAFAEGEDTKYDVSTVPVAEINRRANTLTESLEVDKIPKPVHPIADRLLESGLLEDDVRGITTSSARRGAPSTVFGISTPGPIDRDGPKQFIGKSQSKSATPVPTSRLGGTQFVMDDGNDRYRRKTSATDGPPEYADLLNEETGENGIPKDEYVRLRTRTGHQILLHNSEDLIYISNSRGTSWIEMTSDGKIDIFAEDSISVHTKQDFNFYADRDVNIEAGRNINMKASAKYADEADTDANGFESGRVYIESKHPTKIKAGGSTSITSGANFDVFTTLSNNLTAGATTNLLSTAGHFETAATINMNGIPATPALPVVELPVYDNLVVDPGQAEWIGTRYIASETLKSIMKRIPQHEPWVSHENLVVTVVKPGKTDREGDHPEEEGGEE